LKCLDEPHDPRFVEFAVGVRDQCQRQCVDAWVASEWSDAQLGQSRIVAPWEVLLDLSQSLFDDVEVVGEPVCIGRVDLTMFVISNLRSGVEQNPLVLDEPVEEKALRALRSAKNTETRQPPSLAVKPLEPKQFPSDWV
jgi:hypothetical protein